VEIAQREGKCDALDHLRNSFGALAAGLVTGYTLSGFIHILLVVAIAILLIRLIQGRSVA
jgi:hypothetical protein